MTHLMIQEFLMVLGVQSGLLSQVHHVTLMDQLVLSGHLFQVFLVVQFLLLLQVNQMNQVFQVHLSAQSLLLYQHLLYYRMFQVVRILHVVQGDHWSLMDLAVLSHLWTQMNQMDLVVQIHL